MEHVEAIWWDYLTGFPDIWCRVRHAFFDPEHCRPIQSLALQRGQKLTLQVIYEVSRIFGCEVIRSMQQTSWKAIEKKISIGKERE